MAHAVSLAIAPSGSWGGIYGTAEKHSWMNIYNTEIGSWKNSEGGEAELIEAIVNNVNDNTFGQVISASLILRGVFHSLIELWDKRTFYFAKRSCTRDKNHRPICSRPKAGAIRLYMDKMDESLAHLWNRKDVVPFQIARFKIAGYPPPTESEEYPWWDDIRNNYEATFALILERTGDSASTYRRIGLAEMPGNGSEALGWEIKTVTII